MGGDSTLVISGVTPSSWALIVTPISWRLAAVSPIESGRVVTKTRVHLLPLTWSDGGGQRRLGVPHGIVDGIVH